MGWGRRLDHRLHQSGLGCYRRLIGVDRGSHIEGRTQDQVAGGAWVIHQPVVADQRGLGRSRGRGVGVGCGRVVANTEVITDCGLRGRIGTLVSGCGREGVGRILGYGGGKVVALGILLAGKADKDPWGDPIAGQLFTDGGHAIAAPVIGVGDLGAVYSLQLDLQAMALTACIVDGIKVVQIAVGAAGQGTEGKHQSGKQGEVFGFHLAHPARDAVFCDFDHSIAMQNEGV